MIHIAKRQKWRLDRTQQLNLWLGLLVAITAAWILFTILELARFALLVGSWQEFWARGWSLGSATEPALRSRLFQVIALTLGWSFWFRMRRRQQDDARLRRSEQKYRHIINHAGEAIFLLDADSRILEWNKVAETLFGEPRRAVLNKPFRDVHLCYGVEIERAMADTKRLQRSLNFEFPFPRRGRPDGQISLIISAIGAAPTRNGNEDYTYVVIARDITSEKQLETKMSETEKLAGIGQLAAGIAHQLNTPLGSILLSAQMLEESVDGEDQEEDVRRIIRQTEQCRTIIKGLLNFARPSGKEKIKLNLADVVSETVYLMEKNIKLAGVTVNIREEATPEVIGNRNELDQVFFNLLANSLDAMPKGGGIEVVIGDGAPGEVRIEFSDDGEGIPAENNDRVFMPFYTTKEYGKGTGLGLSIVARIIHEHGGRIEMKSQAGIGTHFYLSLPKPGYGLGNGEARDSKE
jgi:PAS domain S-box-containing protein